MGLNFKLDIGLTSCHGKPVVHRYRANITNASSFDRKQAIADLKASLFGARNEQFALAA